MAPGSFKSFVSIFFSGIVLAVVPAFAIHMNTTLYWQGRMISHCAAGLDEDQRFFMFPRGANACQTVRK